MKKKLLSLLLVSALALSLAACGSNDKDAQTEPAAETEAATEAAEDSSEDETEEASEDAQTDAADEDGEDESDEAAEASAGSVVISHNLGETEVDVNPENIMVMDFGILDIFSTVGIEVGGLPQSNLPEYLSAYTSEDYLNVGNLKEVDFELVNEFSPDLIIISGRLTDSYDELSEIAPTVYVETPGAAYMDSMKNNIDILSQIFPEKAAELETEFAALEADAAELKEAAEESGLNALILMSNDGSISAFGEGSRYGIIHDDFGFAAADEDVDASTHGAEASFEYIAEVNPDVIFVIDRSAAISTEGATGAETLLDNELVNGTNAAQNDKIIYLSSDVWYLSNGGFQGTAQMIEEVNAALN